MYNCVKYLFGHSFCRVPLKFLCLKEILDSNQYTNIYPLSKCYIFTSILLFLSVTIFEKSFFFSIFAFFSKFQIQYTVNMWSSTYIEFSFLLLIFLTKLFYFLFLILFLYHDNTLYNIFLFCFVCAVKCILFSIFCHS